MLRSVRFYILPTEEGKTACVNFDHVANILVGPQTIELYFVGRSEPMVLKKMVTTLSTIAKGMDLSENSKEQINNL